MFLTDRHIFSLSSQPFEHWSDSLTMVDLIDMGFKFTKGGFDLLMVPVYLLFSPNFSEISS